MRRDPILLIPRNVKRRKRQPPTTAIRTIPIWGYEMDFSKFTFCFDWQQLDLDDDTWIEEDKPDQTNNRDLIAMLCNVALAKYNVEKNTKLELSKVLRANFHPSAAATFYISFEVSDPFDGNQTKPYRAVVGYFPGRILVDSCNPRPAS
ncbi:unnamed protein product [Arabis nemorensis]|uniref:Cystatin domain-containing protein n=1 Tax=Arabis nemorensis TaxID=586526 RepID=A0A565CHX4_9BRAS|nr:unnamed protein product [Arabis nemorensis]VVB13279.1 unnamed protein product [Arabis nemorensis]